MAQTFIIPRDTVRAAMEAGIKAAQFTNEKLVADLRNLAETQTRLAFGYTHPTESDADGNPIEGTRCYCPLAELGVLASAKRLQNPYGVTADDVEVDRFIMAFDDYEGWPMRDEGLNEIASGIAVIV